MDETTKERIEQMAFNFYKGKRPSFSKKDVLEIIKQEKIIRR